MQLYADLQIHSRFSRATSERMTIHEIDYYARVKGLNLIGTGDALHPAWLSELKKELDESQASGFYVIKGARSGDLYFVCQTEVATVHEFEGKTRRIHHVVLMPSLEVAEQVAAELSKYGDLSSDGRPVLNVSPAELVESIMQVESYNLVFPAHAWTGASC